MNNNKSTIIGFVLMTLVFVGYMIYATNQQQKQEAQKTTANILSKTALYCFCNASLCLIGT